MFSFIWTYLLPSTGLALLAALLWSVRRERKGAAALAAEQAAHRETGYRLDLVHEQMARVQKQVEEWQAASAEAMRRFRLAEAETAASRARFDEFRAKLQTSPVPDDAEGALAWMADVAKQISAEVGR